MITQRFEVELTTKDAPEDAIAAADELLEALADGHLPAWVWSVDDVEPDGGVVAALAARRAPKRP